MKTLERYEQICMNYLNGNFSDFKKDLKGLTKKEILVLVYQLAKYVGSPPDHLLANSIVHRYL